MLLFLPGPAPLAVFPNPLAVPIPPPYTGLKWCFVFYFWTTLFLKASCWWLLLGEVASLAAPCATVALITEIEVALLTPPEFYILIKFIIIIIIAITICLKESTKVPAFVNNLILPNSSACGSSAIVDFYRKRYLPISVAGGSL